MPRNCGSRLLVPELKKEVKKLHPDKAVSKLNRPALLDLYEVKKKKKDKTKTISQIDIDIKNERDKIKDLDEQIKALKKEKRRKRYTSKSGEYIDPKKYIVDRDGDFHHRF